MSLMWTVVVALSLYDIFAGVSIAFFHSYLYLIAVFSSLKGIYSIITDFPFGVFFLMGMIDLIVGITSLLLFFGRDLWFYPFIGVAILLKGFYCLISSYGR